VGIAFSPDSQTLASWWWGDRLMKGDNTVILWAISGSALEKLACHIVNRNLTHKEWNDYVGNTIAYQPVCADLPVATE
jgi:hypothetical protein